MRTNAIRISFIDERISATATLLWDDAPRVCARVVEALPIEGPAFHAIYSGSEIALEVPQLSKVELERATTRMVPGEIAYVHLADGEYYGVDADVSEVCWVYDIDGQPSMFEGAVPVSVFARFEDLSVLIDVCTRMRREGEKTLLIEAV